MKKHLFSFIILFLSILVSAQNKTKLWSLEDCVNYALENNLQVKQSDLNTELFKAEAERASMVFYPSVSASTSLGYNFYTTESPNTFSNTYGISAESTLYNGLRHKKQKELAEQEVALSFLDSQIVKDDILLQVVNAYMSILFYRENLTITSDQFEVGKELVERMQQLVDAGTNAANDLYQVQATLAANEEAMVSAQNDLDLALLELAQILQIPPKDFQVEAVSLDMSKVSLMYNNSDQVFEKALDWRPEIKRAEMNMDNAALNTAIAETGKAPNIGASYSFGTNYFNSESIDNQDYFDQILDNRGHSLGINASIPIFDRNNTKINVQRAKIQEDIAQNTYQNEYTMLRANIERVYLDAKSASKNYEAAKKSVEAQEEAFRTAKEQFDLGVMTSYDFEQVRNQLVQAQASFASAKYNYFFRVKVLEYYYGLPLKL